MRWPVRVIKPQQTCYVLAGVEKASRGFAQRFLDIRERQSSAEIGHDTDDQRLAERRVLVRLALVILLESRSRWPEGAKRSDQHHPSLLPRATELEADILYVEGWIGGRHAAQPLPDRVRSLLV